MVNKFLLTIEGFKIYRLFYCNNLQIIVQRRHTGLAVLLQLEKNVPYFAFLTNVNNLAKNIKGFKKVLQYLSDIIWAGNEEMSRNFEEVTDMKGEDKFWNLLQL